VWNGYFYADTVSAYLAAQRSFSHLSLYSGAGLSRVETRSGVSGEAVTERVSPDYFDMVGVRPSAGRFFNESDAAVAVISEQFRGRLFGTDSGLGEVITVDTVPMTVIGVTADGFRGLQVDGGFDIIVPFAVVPGIGGRIAATALLAIAIGLAMGVVSAWQSVAMRVNEGLQPGRSMIGSLGRLGRGLLVAQVALPMTLLAAAGLFTTSLARLRANDTSLQSQRIVFARAYREPGDRQLLPRG
jgi:hypothetical protein